MILECRNITFGYKKNNILFKNINFVTTTNDVLGIVARSGFGKSTLAKIISGYEIQVSGDIFLDGKGISKKGYNPIQLIYQHPEKAINPLWKMKKVIKEFDVDDIDYVIDNIGIDRNLLNRYPSELSGGELQRFCIARVLGNLTKFIIADEITTMLDSITQAQIWDFLINECKKRSIGLIVISHNINLLDKLCNNIINLEEYSIENFK